MVGFARPVMATASPFLSRSNLLHALASKQITDINTESSSVGVRSCAVTNVLPDFDVR
jgi:hypothetical protein